MSNENGRRIGWTDEEDDILITYYPLEGSRCFDRLQRSKDACYRRVSRLGIKCNNKNIKGKIGNGTVWTYEEDRIILQYYPIEGSLCYHRLHNRSESACKSRWNKLSEGMDKASRKWTVAEDAIIIQYYPTEGGKVSRRMHGRTSTECRYRAIVLGIGKRYNKVVS